MDYLSYSLVKYITNVRVFKTSGFLGEYYLDVSQDMFSAGLKLVFSFNEI